MKTVLAVVALLALSCANFLHRGDGAKPARPARAAAAPEARCPSCDGEIAEVMVERDQCQAELLVVKKERPRVEAKVVEKEVPGPARHCAVDLPSLVPVEGHTCQPDTLCLDTKAQAAVAANELAWREWMSRVRQCEGVGP